MDRSQRLRSSIVTALAVVLAGCGGLAPTQPAPATPTPVTSAAAPSSQLATAHPGNGVADPAGRIAFGRVIRFDSFYGPVIAIWAVDPDGSDLAQLTTGESGFPSWSPDGRSIAFTQRQPDGTWQIARMNADGSGVHVLTKGFGADNASWSPDGASIVFTHFATATADPAFHTTTWQMDADGSNARPLGKEDAFDVEPKISPDGTTLLFERLSFPGGEQRDTLVLLDLRSGKERTLEAAGSSAEHGAWSPDGKWIVYVASPNLGATLPKNQIQRIAADGSGTVTVLFGGTDVAAGFKPSYSPDGLRIAFGCTFAPSESQDLCAMDVNGSGVERIVDDTVDEDQSSWGIAPGS